MKKLVMFGMLMLGVQFVHADYLRTRDTLGKSSFSAVALDHVKLSSSASFVRAIIFSGVAPATVTIFNVQENAPGDTSTRTTVYFPGGSGAAGMPNNPVRVDVSVMNSSGTMILKFGTAYTQFDWDWYTRPDYASPLNGGN